MCEKGMDACNTGVGYTNRNYIHYTGNAPGAQESEGLWVRSTAYI